MVQVIGTRAFAYGATGRPLDGIGYLLLVAGPAALAVRTKWPLVSLVGALAATGFYFAQGYPAGPGFLAALVAVFGALRSGRRVLTWAITAAAFAAAGWHSVRDHTHELRIVVMVGVWCVVVLGLAEAARIRTGRYAEIVRARALEQARAADEAEKAAKEAEKAAKEAQRASAEQERRQTSEERLQIARELHDVLGHHLSLINVQAGVGLHLMDERPEQARAALAAIKHASAEALRETRAVLAALNPRDQSAPRAPTPGLRDLEALIKEVTAAGLPVTCEVEGDARDLPAEVDRAAYRIVQEALTNVRRHAGPAATADVHIEYRPGALDLRVTDDGTGGAPADNVHQGSGIAGMRERASALGGSVEAGPRPDAGFAVRAHLPTPESESR